MGYFLCLQKCVKQQGIVRRGYIIKSDISGKYLTPLDIRGRPEGDIQTLVNGSSLLAKNDHHDFKGKMIETDYEGIYKTGTEFFFVQQKGQSATLKMVDLNAAHKLWLEMLNKVVKNPDVFLDPVEVKQRNVRDILIRAEEERPQRELAERVAGVKKKPYWWLEHPELCPDIIDFN